MAAADMVPPYSEFPHATMSPDTVTTAKAMPFEWTEARLPPTAIAAVALAVVVPPFQESPHVMMSPDTVTTAKALSVEWTQAGAPPAAIAAVAVASIWR
jgi:hypothetical protein